MVRLPVKKTTRLLEGESRSKVVGCNNTSFLFAKLQKTMNSRKRFKEKKQKNFFAFVVSQTFSYFCRVKPKQ